MRKSTVIACGIKIFIICLIFNQNIFSSGVIAERINRLDSLIPTLQESAKIDSILVLVDLCSYDLPYIGLKWGNDGLDLIRENQKFKYKKGYLFNFIGKIYNQTDDFKNAEYYFQKAKNTMEKHDDKYGLAIAYYYIAYNAISLRNFQLAGDYFLKAINFAKESNNIKIIADANSSLGVLNYILGNNKESLSRSFRGLELSTKIDYKEGMALACEHLGLTYLSISDYPNTKKYLEKALYLQEFIGNKFGIAEAMESFSVYYLYQNDNNKALELLNKSLLLSEELNVKQSIASALTNLGAVYENVGDYPKSLSYFANSIKILEELNDLRGLYYAYRRMSYTYEKIGEYKKALESYRLFKNIYDSVYTDIRAQTIYGLESKIESTQKDYELRKLALQNESTKKIQIYLFASLIMACIVILVIYYALAQKKRVNQKLAYINKQLEENQEALETANNNLTNANKEKDKFIKILAHDLRSPFFGILGISSLIASDFDSFQKHEMKQHLYSLNGALRTLFELLDNLLTWSRFNSRKISYTPETFNASEIINNSFDIFKFNLLEKSINPIISIDDKIPIHADKNMFESTIRNLISNAIKFSTHGGKIQIYAEKIGDFLSIEVADEGVGIDQDTINNILKNKSVSTPGTKNEKGSGLGLELCQEFVVKNGGEFFIESNNNFGTKIKFTTPLSKS